MSTAEESKAAFESGVDMYDELATKFSGASQEVLEEVRRMQSEDAKRMEKMGKKKKKHKKKSGSNGSNSETKGEDQEVGGDDDESVDKTRIAKSRDMASLELGARGQVEKTKPGILDEPIEAITSPQEGKIDLDEDVAITKVEKEQSSIEGVGLLTLGMKQEEREASLGRKPEEVNNDKDDTKEVQKEEAVENKQEREERIKYFATRLVADLENLYGNYESEEEAEQEKFARAAARLRKGGVIPLYVQDERGRIIDVNNGLDLASIIKDFLALDSGVPEDWEVGLKFIRDSKIDISELEEARKRKDEFSARGEKEKPIRDERYVWYQGIDGDLIRVTKLPPKLGEGPTKQEIAELERYTEQKATALENLRKRIPSIDEKLKLDRGQIYWAARILGGGEIFEDGKQVNPWPTKEEALNYLRGQLGIDRRGVDREVSVSEDVEPKLVSVEDNRVRIHNMLIGLSELNEDSASRTPLIESLEAEGVKIKEFITSLEKLTPAKRSEILMQLRAVVEIWRMDDVKRREYPTMGKVAETYARVLGLG